MTDYQSPHCGPDYDGSLPALDDEEQVEELRRDRESVLEELEAANVAQCDLENELHDIDDKIKRLCGVRP